MQQQEEAGASFLAAMGVASSSAAGVESSPPSLL